MPITVRFFAAAREAAGVSEASFAVRTGATVADALFLVAALYPTLVPLLARSRAAVNQEYVDTSHLLRDGDELAIIPPVSGG